MYYRFFCSILLATSLSTVAAVPPVGSASATDLAALSEIANRQGAIERVITLTNQLFDKVSQLKISPSEFRTMEILHTHVNNILQRGSTEEILKIEQQLSRDLQQMAETTNKSGTSES